MASDIKEVGLQHTWYSTWK